MSEVETYFESRGPEIRAFLGLPRERAEELARVRTGNGYVDLKTAVLYSIPHSTVNGSPDLRLVSVWQGGEFLTSLTSSVNSAGRIESLRDFLKDYDVNLWCEQFVAANPGAVRFSSDLFESAAIIGQTPQGRSVVLAPLRAV